MNKTRIVFVCFSASILASCASGPQSSYQPYIYEQTAYYPSSSSYYENDVGYNNQITSQSSQVNVPESWHVGSYRSPVSAKDRDQRWVSKQNSQGYTIEIANDEKASQVAKKLYQIPKKEPMAELKYQQNGKSYYKGLYGSYNSQEEAQHALDALPAEVKQGAAIQSWGNVQGSLTE